MGCRVLSTAWNSQIDEIAKQVDEIANLDQFIIHSQILINSAVCPSVSGLDISRSVKGPNFLTTDTLRFPTTRRVRVDKLMHWLTQNQEITA